jgi:hypothetical protein
MWRRASVRVLGTVLLALVMVGVPVAAFGVATHASGAATLTCVDKRPGPAPIIDHVGKVDVPRAYCYDAKDKDHPGWHDYCSSSADSWSASGITVSFKGSCALHDMCLEYGWAVKRSSCDTIFSVYMHRNCAQSVAQSKVSGLLKGWVTNMCNGKAERMYVGVSLWTLKGAGYKHGNFGCFTGVLFGTVFCLGTAPGSGGGGAWRT